MGMLSYYDRIVAMPDNQLTQADLMLKRLGTKLSSEEQLNLIESARTERIHTAMYFDRMRRGKGNWSEEINVDGVSFQTENTGDRVRRRGYNPDILAHGIF